MQPLLKPRLRYSELVRSAVRRERSKSMRGMINVICDACQLSVHRN